MSGTNMTKEDAARIQSTQATGGKDMSSSGFASRAQSAGDRNLNTQGTGSAGSGNIAGKSGGQAGSNKK